MINLELQKKNKKNFFIFKRFALNNHESLLIANRVNSPLITGLGWIETTHGAQCVDRA